MNGNIDSVKVRMYKTGSVGDCILLLFQKGAAVTFSMLIDCGGIKTTSALMSPCVDDIRKTCDGKLDLLVVTHQHEDHISGFNLARPVFEQITVGEVWMSWVEDPTDDIAKMIKKQFGKKLKDLKHAAAGASAALKKLSNQKSDVMGVERRFGAGKQSVDETMALLAFEEGQSYGKGLAAGKATNDDAMNFVKKKGKKITYHLPGDVIKDMKGTEGIKFYILGPPRDPDLKFLKIEMDEDEIYHLALTASPGSLSATTNDHITQSGVTLAPGASPFSNNFKMSNAEEVVFKKKYNNADFRWRQIETDWLSSSGGMALALNRFTNNTSLAMALEFSDTGSVILLPADAQSGNWMSWQKPDVMKKLKANGGKDTNELLASTKFYKVGHHGSHNGTASTQGLEKINRPDLVAFMPLVQDKVPAAWGGAANFPAKKLYQALIDKTKGRIVRTDEGVIKDASAVKMRQLLPRSVSSDFNNNVQEKPLYFEYTVHA
jgi:beta-lactamase superfamily II metal-dependent hydrolase